jgi:ribosomal protein S2
MQKDRMESEKMDAEMTKRLDEERKEWEKRLDEERKEREKMADKLDRLLTGANSMSESGEVVQITDLSML